MNKKGGVVLLSKADVRAQLISRLDSRAFWVLIPDERNFAHLEEIEAKFYDGEANADFDIFMLPFLGLPTVATAKKSRMSPLELIAHVQDYSPTPLSVEVLAKRDVIFLADQETVAGLIDGMLNLLQAPELN